MLLLPCISVSEDIASWLDEPCTGGHSKDLCVEVNNSHCGAIAVWYAAVGGSKGLLARVDA